MEKRGIKIAAQNRKAYHDYFVEERYEAGIELAGTEVKSIRGGRVNLKDSYCVAKDGELFALSMHISPYEQGNIFNRDPDRPKRLLLHKREIRKLHALQKQEKYPFLSLRTLLVPVVNFGSQLAWPIFLAGLIFSWQPLMTVGIVLFGLVVLFSLITLPVEFDASRRAVAMLCGQGYLTQEEEKGVKAVLRAAALTYVASFVSALMQLLRLLALARRRD